MAKNPYGWMYKKEEKKQQPTQIIYNVPRDWGGWGGSVNPDFYRDIGISDQDLVTKPKGTTIGPNGTVLPDTNTKNTGNVIIQDPNKVNQNTTTSPVGSVSDPNYSTSRSTLPSAPAPSSTATSPGSTPVGATPNMMEGHGEFATDNFAMWRDKEGSDAAEEYWQVQLPLMELQQNAKTQDFNSLLAANQFDWTKTVDQWNMMQQGQEFQFNQQQADIANKQWATTENREREQFNIETQLANRGLDIQQFSAEQQVALGKEANQIAKFEAETGRIDVQGRLALDNKIAEAQISADNFANDTERIKVMNDYTINKQLADSDQAYKEGMLGVEQYNAAVNEAYGKKELAIDEMYKQGLISNQEYANETERLLGEQKNRILEFEAETGRIDVEGRNRYQDGLLKAEQARLALDTTLGMGRLNLDTMTQQQLNAYRYAQMSQEATLQREQMRSQELQNRYSVFGRSQAPAGMGASGGWTRNWS